jgi:serine protease Do
MNKKNQSYVAAILTAGLILGAVGGVFGSLVVYPYIKTESNSPTASNLYQSIYEVTENSATIEAVEKTSPAVVSVVVFKELANVYNYTGPDPFDFFGREIPFNGKNEEKRMQEIGGGSGFVIDSSGLIITNKHVVLHTDAEYFVIFNDGKKYKAEVVGRDPVSDIAVLKIEATNLPMVKLGNSDTLKIGQTVIAIGNALGEYRNTVTRGVISGINRRVVAGDSSGGAEVLDEAIQTDAAINPGNSGGPLLDLGGNVIGINTAMNWQGQAIGFAIPINQAKIIIDSVKKHGRIVRPWIGVRYVQISEEISGMNNLKYDYGALIVSGMRPQDVAVIPGSPAAKSGIGENDIILEVNGVKLNGDKTLLGEISKYSPGNEVELKIFQNGEEKKIKLKLEERK